MTFLTQYCSGSLLKDKKGIRVIPSTCNIRNKLTVSVAMSPVDAAAVALMVEVFKLSNLS